MLQEEDLQSEPCSSPFQSNSVSQYIADVYQHICVVLTVTICISSQILSIVQLPQNHLRSFYKTEILEFCSSKTNLTGNHEVAGSILALLNGLRIQHCSEQWCRLQMRLGSCVVVALAQASRNSSDQTPSLGSSICHGCGPKKKTKRQKEKKNRDSQALLP